MKVEKGNKALGLKDKTGLSTGMLDLLAGAMLVVSLVPLWSSRFFPSQNGPEYLLFIHMVKEYCNPTYNYADYYEPVFVLVPNLLTQLITLLFSYLTDWLSAYKLTLSVSIIGLSMSILYFVRSVNPEKYFMGFAAFLYSYNYYIFKGYDNFLFSIGLFLIYFGYFIRHQETLTSRRLFILTLLLFALYFAHMFTFLVASLITLIYVLLLGKDFKWMLRIGMTFIPGLIFFGQYLLSVVMRIDALVRPHQFWLRYDPLTHPVYYFLEMTNYSISFTTYCLFLIPMALLSYMVLRRLPALWRMWQSIRSEKGTVVNLSTEDRILVITIILTGVFFLLPREVAGWPKLNERVLPFIYVGIIASARPFVSRIFNRLTLLVFVVFSLTIYVIMTIEIMRLGQVIEDYVSGIPIIQRNKTLLPVKLEDFVVGRIRPLDRVFNYYNLFKGGATGKSVVQYTGRVPMKYRVEPIEKVFPRFDPLHPEQADMTRIRRAYDYILCWGKDDRIFALFQKHGFRKIYQQGKLTLLANERMTQEAGSF